MILAIDWTMTPEIFTGLKTPNLYGILFVTGLVIGYFVVKQMFKKEGIKDDVLDKLVMYMVIGTIVGARLGHVLFYGPYYDEVIDGRLVEGYFSHPLDIFKVWQGGLASHGAAIAILIGLYTFSKYTVKKPFLWILDRISAPTAMGAVFIRLGNLVNHEIVGHPTDVPWAFKFHNYWNSSIKAFDATPRHPAQLYESICYLISFGILMFLFWKRDAWKKPGFVFGTFLVLIFGTRLIVEFFKLGQTARDEVLFLNTGQLLSIPFIIVGIVLIYRAISNKNKDSNTNEKRIS
jgi:prolipoprotein diacylglyceryl transferase